MISVANFIKTLQKNNINFFCGVPDSLLKSFCAYLTDTVTKENHIITANEGSAVGLAAGHYLATGNPAVVYMQNSGEGNAVNPLASLVDPKVYKIPVLLIIGWRGEPGKKDEPQHAKQGEITLGLLNTLGIDYAIVPQEETEVNTVLEKAILTMNQTSSPYALVIRKDTFEPYTLQKSVQNPYTMSRESAIRKVMECIEQSGKKSVLVSTTGMISREVYENRIQMNGTGETDFLTVGSMGHASSIALGISLAKRDCNVFCLDGDGAVIMHMGSLAINATNAQGNFKHIVFNNGAHDSVGGQPTVGFNIDLEKIASGCGYKHIYHATNESAIQMAMEQLIKDTQPAILEILVKKGARKDLGRPKSTPQDNKEKLMNFLMNK